MKRLLFSLLFAMLLCLTPYAVYAAPMNIGIGTSQAVSQEKELEFWITGGVDVTKEMQSTFDSSRTISGTTLQGTGITIQVSTKDAGGEIKEDTSYTTEVGASGLFSEAISLGLGENTVTVTATKEGYKEICQSVVIRRKKLQIKRELENTISIPGSTRASLFIVK